jgi:hypothetical protein
MVRMLDALRVLALEQKPLDESLDRERGRVCRF